jgi:alcohol dehydrogenase
MAKSYYEFFCPVKVVAGHKALEHIPFELSTLQSTRPMIITDKGVVAVGLLKHVEAAFEGAEAVVAAVFDDVPPDSSMQTVRRAAAAYRENNCDAIIAVGGGSVIDTCKAVNILVSEGSDDLYAFSGAHNLKRPLKPLFVVPTTAGTGSETTMVAVISDTEKGVKVPFTSYFLLPNAAILDPRMTLTLPPHITAMTAMDAMTHAVESFTCLAANPISDAYATGAIRKISENLLKVMDNPSDADGRLELAQASTMAGIAFSNAMVGLVHSLGHSLGAVCHLPHGLCMNLFLPYVLEYNMDVNGDRIGELLLPLAGADVYATTPRDQRAARAIATLREMRDELHARCKLPRTLQETGKVQQEQLAQVAELTVNDGSIIFNPKETDRQEALAILKRAWA